MIKGGRKAKLNAIENQSKLRIEKLFMALNKESLNKLRAKIMPESLTTPIALLNEENEFNDAIKNSPNNKATHNLSKTVGRKSKKATNNSFLFSISLLKFNFFTFIIK